MRIFWSILALALFAGSAWGATHEQRMAELSPSLRQWVGEEAKRVDTASLDVDAVKSSAQRRLAGQDYTDADVTALMTLVLQQVAKDADEDLHAMAEDMRQLQQQREAQRKARRESLEAQSQAREKMRQEYAEDPSARMQILQDRRAKALETLSNIMKKSSDTSAGISKNLK